MPLILAIEPDRLQASHIVAVLRGRPRTELVIADSAAVALKAIAARVPDLLLTSPLLSRQDEAGLAEWLRGLGPAAAHVQQLTIPILATAAPQATRGMLSVLRRRPRTSSPAGCEPSMFASQVGLYLERATRERVEEPAADVPPEPALELSAAELPPAPPPEPALELSPAELPAAAIEPDPEPAVTEIDTAVSNQIEAAIALAALRAEESSRWVVVPLDEVEDEPAYVPEPAPVEPITDDVWVLTPAPEVDELMAEAPADPSDIGSVILLTPIYDLPPEPPWWKASSPHPAVDVDAPAPEVMAPPPEVMAPPPEVVAPAAEVVAAPATTRRRKVEKPKPKPVQDEWGLFDPSQCGFAALLDKLDEITAQERTGRKRDDVEVRVISY